MSESVKFIKKLFDGDVEITQGFGEHPEVYGRYGLKGHNGIDFKMPIGTRVLAGCKCSVIKDVITSDRDGYGNHLVAKIKTNNKTYQLIWAHLDKITLPGVDLDEVSVIGLSGNSGSVTEGGLILPEESADQGAGARLHFGVRELNDGGKVMNEDNGYDGYIDPVPFLSFISEQKEGEKNTGKKKKEKEEEK